MIHLIVREEKMYVLNQSEQKRILASCDLLSEDWQNWRKEYKEKETDRIWIEYYPHSGMHGGGPVYLKEKGDDLNFSRLADKYLSSQREEDWIGFVTDLFPTLAEGEELVAYLEARKGRYSREAVRILHDRIRINRGSLIGKHVSEINEEFTRISRLKERIRNLQQGSDGNAEKPPGVERER